MPNSSIRLRTRQTRKTEYELLEPRQLLAADFRSSGVEFSNSQFPGAPNASVVTGATSSSKLASDPNVFREIIFVDPSVWEHNALPEELASIANEVFVLDDDHSGLSQIAEYLRGQDSVDAIHIFSHGEAGGIKRLGNSSLTAQNISLFEKELVTIGASLSPDADLLLWGCDLAAGSTQLIQSITELTDADCRGIQR